MSRSRKRVNEYGALPGDPSSYLEEASGVAVMMGGSPAYTHVPMLIEALDELES